MFTRRGQPLLGKFVWLLRRDAAWMRRGRCLGCARRRKFRGFPIRRFVERDLRAGFGRFGSQRGHLRGDRMKGGCRDCAAAHQAGRDRHSHYGCGQCRVQSPSPAHRRGSNGVRTCASYRGHRRLTSGAVGQMLLTSRGLGPGQRAVAITRQRGFLRASAAAGIARALKSALEDGIELQVAALQRINPSQAWNDWAAFCCIVIQLRSGSDSARVRSNGHSCVA